MVAVFVSIFGSYNLNETKFRKKEKKIVHKQIPHKLFAMQLKLLIFNNVATIHRIISFVHYGFSDGKAS